DESEDGDRQGQFLYGGFTTSVDEWSHLFTPEWERNVLNKQPQIPYLHMVDIRSRQWRSKHGLTEYQADCRIDAACELIGRCRTLCFHITKMPGGHFRS